MSESRLEKKLKNRVERLGGWAMKFTSPGISGVPDRLIILPGKMLFVEMKAPGGKLRPLQVKRKKQIESFGHDVYVVNSEESLERFIKEVFDGIYPA
ncbi:VRR-NUC domain-containing protein [Halobacillus karajensis]|uniref:VRR-NUC domain-containing protein n=1 Tax=Halobacillus karajensis TaxID=195088 RepID=UPI00045CB4AE|nr:VRR-NUC domain-containing protein [Halobacillus karajensis]CDQ17960.1 VRR-NUC domain protein [Halobacillus karajensis]